MTTFREKLEQAVRAGVPTTVADFYVKGSGGCMCLVYRPKGTDVTVPSRDGAWGYETDRDGFVAGWEVQPKRSGGYHCTSFAADQVDRVIEYWHDKAASYGVSV